MSNGNAIVSISGADQVHVAGCAAAWRGSRRDMTAYALSLFFSLPRSPLFSQLQGSSGSMSSGGLQLLRSDSDGSDDDEGGGQCSPLVAVYHLLEAMVGSGQDMSNANMWVCQPATLNSPNRFLVTCRAASPRLHLLTRPAVLCCAVLCCAVLCCAVLCCARASCAVRPACA